ncbi:TIGR03986 family type III CRISPR-associated RAMP protein [Cyanobacterium aponinum]|uniref:CRISPR type III-associated protein domain-containing protein n=1 Tax=Cyanobacterium aponinum (strain PCC 10605) TaxID=755178 RepID=K9Z0L1_CYAAP|nr:TIGR03986 family CRISPR-associated RAMP protein [Cyanobacterium aponinum]AFZ52721.1 protein of unknown function DUF324 [Cyanobacterium aponinum PCC 10605]
MEGKFKIQKGNLTIVYIDKDKDNKEKKISPPNDELSASILEIKKTSVKSLKDMEIEFDLVDGKAQKIREKGKSWEISAQAEAKQSKPATVLTSSIEVTGDFHNPYNFIPTPPRKNDNSELFDRAPVGHGKYHQDYWSGNITVKLKTKTPLLIPDAGNATEDNNGHKTYPLRIGADGKPLLPITSVKGALRLAYEIVTNSRYSIFEKHEDRLAYRTPARITVVPARVESKDGKLFLRIMDDTGLVGETARLKRYEKNSKNKDKGESHVATKYKSKNRLPIHGDAVWVKLSRGKVEEIIPRDQNPSNTSWKKGWVCVTGANINGKMNERVFIEQNNNDLIPVTPEIKSLWEELIRNYQQTHVKDLEKRKSKNQSPTAYLGGKPGETGWSKHIWDEKELQFQEGTLCYVELNNRGKITAIQPVTISRRLYKYPPDDLLDDSLKPAQKMEQLSPVDRVFGWVNQNGKGSYKGNLRINALTCITDNCIENFGNKGLPLNILGQPQPSQARFYQAQDKKGTPLDNGSEKGKGYSNSNQGLRGRKVYPHQNLPANHWDNANQDRTQQDNNGHYQEYYRPGSERDDQNRSILGWVKPNTEFTFNIDITNLSTVELGALLLILDLPKNHYHRLGGGKPFGFGSVKLTIDWDKTDLRKGEDWKEYYSSLLKVDKPDATVAKASIGEFKQAVETSYNGKFEEVSFIKALLVATQGYSDKLPIHYPRLDIQPNPNGEAFKWFVENERTGNSGGLKVALPMLANDGGLPRNPS